MNRVSLIMAALSEGPKTNAELCEVADEIPPYMSRTMAKLIHRGKVVNANKGHKVASYQLRAQP